MNRRDYECDEDREARADYEAEMAAQAEYETAWSPPRIRRDYRTDEAFHSLEASAPNSDD